MMMPVVFVAHGSPMVAIESNPYAQFLDGLHAQWERPRAIIVFSAHWLSRVQQISQVDRNTTLYDFGGFPEPLYRVRYPAPGDPGLAGRIHDLLAQFQISANEDTVRGLDHGVWTILHRIYPAADIPVVAMSVNPELAPAAQYQIGQALAPLRAEGVLIIASGVLVHNFATVDWNQGEGEGAAWALEFEQWMDAKLSQGDRDALFDAANSAPHARLAVAPGGNDHFVPIFYAMGAGFNAETVRCLYRSFQFGTMSNSVYLFSGSR